MDADMLAVVTDLVRAISRWETGGFLAVAIAAVYGLVRLTKLPLVAGLFVGRTWLRWVVAAVLGGVAGALTALQAHAPWAAVASSFLAGALTAGLGAVGLDSAASSSSRAGQASATIRSEVEALVEAGDAEAHASVAAGKMALDSAAATPAGPERRKALAASWAGLP
jgi:hypothetical protein